MKYKHFFRIAAAFCLLLLITGCNPLLNQTYTVVTEHGTASSQEETTLEAENYEELVSCILTFVYEGVDSGTVRLKDYDGASEQDIYAACQEVLNRTAIGNYALKDLDYYCTHVVSYYECRFIYSYAHTPEQIWSVVQVDGVEEILEQLKTAMAGFRQELLLEVNDSSLTKLDVQSLAKQAYYSQPSCAVEYPQVSVYAYPEKGDSRIVEVQLVWSGPQAQMSAKAAALDTAIANVVGRKVSGDLSGAWQLYSRLCARVDWQEEGGSAAYDALVLGQADSQGVALAYQALCEDCGIPCYSVRGTRDDSAHWWNIITVDGVSWHVDLTDGATEDSFLHTDEEMNGRYSWSGEEYPACRGS